MSKILTGQLTEEKKCYSCDEVKAPLLLKIGKLNKEAIKTFFSDT